MKTLAEAQIPASSVKTGIEPTDESADAPTSSSKCTQEHVGVLVTPGDRWPTANMQAFAETPELEVLFIMGGNAEKFQNLKKHPEATVLVDTRDIGKVEAFDITRVDSGACERGCEGRA